MTQREQPLKIAPGRYPNIVILNEVAPGKFTAQYPCCGKTDIMTREQIRRRMRKEAHAQCRECAIATMNTTKRRRGPNGPLPSYWGADAIAEYKAARGEPFWWPASVPASVLRAKTNEVIPDDT